MDNAFGYFIEAFIVLTDTLALFDKSPMQGCYRSILKYPCSRRLIEDGLGKQLFFTQSCAQTRREVVWA